VWAPGLAGRQAALLARTARTLSAPRDEPRVMDAHRRGLTNPAYLRSGVRLAMSDRRGEPPTSATMEP
jgi:hypothetical protein